MWDFFGRWYNIFKILKGKHMTFRAVARCVLHLIFVMVVVNCSKGYDAETGIYEGEGITVSFPAGWMEEETTPGAKLTLRNPDGSAQIDLIIQELPENTTLEEYLNRVSSRTGMVRASEKDKGSIIIGDSDSRWVRRSIKVDSQSFESIAYYVVNRGMVYSIMCTANAKSFEKWEAAFDEVAKSIRFSD
jgi:hypothetical protein